MDDKNMYKPGEITARALNELRLNGLVYSWNLINNDNLMKFKIGDRVQMKCYAPKGEYGTVIFISNSNDGILVKFENYHDGHDGLQYGNTTNCGDSGYWVEESDLVLITEKKTFAPNKNAKELGIDTSRKFVVVEQDLDKNFRVGDIIELIGGGDSTCPLFKRCDEIDSHYISWYRLAYADEEKEPVKKGLIEECKEASSTLGCVESALRCYGTLSSEFAWKDENGFNWTLPNLTKKPNIIKKTMTNIIEFAKNITLSADEKLLRKHGLKDSEGNFTREAWIITERSLLEANEAKLIEIAKAKEAEEKK